MGYVSIFVRLGLLALMTGCANTPAPVYFTLVSGSPVPQLLGQSPRVAITQVSLPDMIDRPQLVVRTNGNQVRISEKQRWAEPLRRQISRVVADDLGKLLESNQVIAMPFDAQVFDADFRLMLNVQRMEAVEGLGADIDIVWRLEPRTGMAVMGRSVVHEPTVGTEAGILVLAQRRALSRVADEIAIQIRGLYGKHQ